MSQLLLLQGVSTDLIPALAGHATNRAWFGVKLPISAGLIANVFGASVDASP